MSKSIILFTLIVVILQSRQLKINIDDCQPVAAKPQFYLGKANNWVNYPSSSNPTGISVYVNITAFGFQTPPFVFTSLTGISNHWTLTGVSSVYDLTKDGFSVYIRQSIPLPLSVARANELSYVLNYILFPAS